MKVGCEGGTLGQAVDLLSPWLPHGEEHEGRCLRGERSPLQSRGKVSREEVPESGCWSRYDEPVVRMSVVLVASMASVASTRTMLQPQRPLQRPSHWHTQRAGEQGGRAVGAPVVRGSHVQRRMAKQELLSEQPLHPKRVHCVMPFLLETRGGSNEKKYKQMITRKDAIL